MTGLVTPRRALISVSDKAGIAEIAQTLGDYSIEILSTGGTAEHLRAQGVALRDVAEVTGQAEMMDGRVKTLHPRIHGGILARRGVDDAELEAHGIPPIDIVIVNLYPFERVAGEDRDEADIIENIDIGGPAMLRAAAKNFADVVAITDSEDLARLEEELAQKDGATSLAFREHMARIAFARVAAYDAAIANWMNAKAGSKFPRRDVRAASRGEILRYGENPHQEAAFYKTGNDGFASAKLIQGKPLSYNNLADADAAWALIGEFRDPSCAIIKHANPCGVGQSDDGILEAYRKALAADPVSAFGGIIALNRPLDAPTAEAILPIFTELVIAPKISAEAIEIFAQKPNIRVLAMERGDAPLMRKEIAGGWLLQDADNGSEPLEEFEVVSARAPSEDERHDLYFAWKIARHVKSNAIVFVKDRQSVGIGAGQMSRVDAVRIAVQKMGETAKAAGGARPRSGFAVASDAFFPFADGLEAAAKAGASAVIQPGGSKRDKEVIQAANDAGLAMLFTHRRHFRH